jgi:alginate O-acetyltransferase complex protein AlgI
MTITSPAFAGFVIAVLLAAFAAGRRLRWLVLLVASYACYAAWSHGTAVVLAAVTLLSYGAGRVLERDEPSPRRTVALWGGIGAAGAALVALKYAGPWRDAVAAAAAPGRGPAASALPGVFLQVGVSYWVLQVIAYLVDVAQGAIPAERHLGRYALYLAFFPKMLQGPIERAGRFLPQVREAWSIRAADLAAAFPLVLWGLFQKLVVADRLAPFVDAVYGAPARYPGLPAVVGTYLFAAQLYFDFAGYTCIAMGIGRGFGVRLSRNFDAPYLAESIADFWRRWHISFSSWILDYVFKPIQLGLRRWRTLGTPVALLVTFAFSGVWHGATWGFVIWGIAHGVFLSSAVSWDAYRKRRGVRGPARRPSTPARRALRILVTFQLVCVAWVFFRASTVHDALFLLWHAVTALPRSVTALVRGGAGHELFLDQGGPRFAFAMLLVGAATLLPRAFPDLRSIEAPLRPAGTPAPWARAVAYALMAYLVVFAGGTAPSFIYSQF